MSYYTIRVEFKQYPPVDMYCTSYLYVKGEDERIFLYGGNTGQFRAASLYLSACNSIQVIKDGQLELYYDGMEVIRYNDTPASV